MAEQIFIDGMSIQQKQLEKAPWIKGQIGIKLDKFIAFAKEHVDERGWVNVSIKESKSGDWYCALDTWKRDKLEKPESLEEETSDEPF